MPPWIKVSARYAYRSLREFLFLVFFSFMPVWLGAITHFLFNQSIPSYLNSYLINGEALLLSATTVGPLMFTLVNIETSKVRRSFPLKWVYYLAITGICVVAALLIGVQATPRASDIVSPAAMQVLSLTVSTLSVLVWFAIVGTNAAHEVGAPDIMRQDEIDFINSYRGQ
jgi:hypothetical protein